MLQAYFQLDRWVGAGTFPEALVGSSRMESLVMCTVELGRPGGGMHTKVKKGENVQVTQLVCSVNHKNTEF